MPAHSNMPPLWAASLVAPITLMVALLALTTKGEFTMLFAVPAAAMILGSQVHQVHGHQPTKVPIVI